MLKQLKGKTVVLFGAGREGKNLLSKMIDNEVRPSYFVDNDKNKKTIGEFSVVSPEVLLSESKENLSVIITPEAPFYADIETQIINLGLSECLLRKEDLRDSRQLPNDLSNSYWFRMSDPNLKKPLTPPVELTEWKESPEHHLEQGEREVEKICEVLGQNNIELESLERVLEFGCSNCRILRHFIDRPERVSLWGTDIQAKKVFWAMENLTELNLIVNSIAPPLPFCDGYFGLIYATSVFTHLVNYHTAWVAELARVIRPGGYAYLTFHDEICIKKHITDSLTGTSTKNWEYNLTRDIRENGLEEKVIRFDFDFLICGSYYGGKTAQSNVLMSGRYISKITEQFFERIDVIPDGHSNWQTVYLFRRKQTDI